MRRMAMAVGVMVTLVQLSAADAEEKRRSDEVIGGVISGLLGQPQGSPNAAYAAQERDRLVSLLQNGEYATSRQGEPIDMVVFGIPLTHRDHVYSAKPIQPSQTPWPHQP